MRTGIHRLLELQADVGPIKRTLVDVVAKFARETLEGKDVTDFGILCAREALTAAVEDDDSGGRHWRLCGAIGNLSST